MTRRVVLVGLLLAALGLPAAAQEARVYDLEVIVFEHLDGHDPEPPAKRRPELAGAIELRRPAAAGEDESGVVVHALEEAAVSAERPVIPLGGDDYRLDRVAARLQRGRDYRVLLHAAWRQRLVPEAAAPRIRLHGGEDLRARVEAAAAESEHPWAARGALDLPAGPVEELDGTLSVRLSRYLHVDTDLVFRDIARREITESGYTLQLPFVRDHALRQSRRMRSEKLHYLDHPRFGLLIEAFPVEQEDGDS